MNTLLLALIRALRSHVWLRFLGFAYILSSLGNGLTQVIVFGQLLNWQASPAILTIVYMLSMLPSFMGSILGEALCKKVSPLRILIFTELLGLLALVFPLYGLLHHNVPALLAVQCAEALFSGMSYPALALLFKRGLAHDELPAATAMETIIFASQVLLGTGLGVLLFDLISPLNLLAIDAVSFVASTALLLTSASVFQAMELQPEKAVPDTHKLFWRCLSPLQKRSVMLLPALAAVGSPAMALLPALAQEIRPEESAGLALPLLFARSLGQLCGPLMLDAGKLQRYSANNWLLLLCLGIYIGNLFSNTFVRRIAIRRACYDFQCTHGFEYCFCFGYVRRTQKFRRNSGRQSQCTYMARTGSDRGYFYRYNKCDSAEIGCFYRSLQHFSI
ncbi:hypothetical protein ACVW03_000762 [Pantoea agglomerans]